MKLGMFPERTDGVEAMSCQPKKRQNCLLAPIRLTEAGGTPMEKDGSKEQLGASDTCGRCGCARRDHVPVCSSHLNARTSATRNVRRSRRSENDRALQPGLQNFRKSTISFAHAPLKETIWDQAIWNGPGRRRYQHLGLFLFADHLSHPRQDVPSERFRGETLGLSLGPTVGSRAQKWSSLRCPFLTLARKGTPRAELALHTGNGNRRLVRLKYFSPRLLRHRL